MATYDENKVVNLGRLATYDFYMREHIGDLIEDTVFSEDVDINGETSGTDEISLSEINDNSISTETTWSSEKISGLIGTAGSNKNLLDNWDFTNPVNRREYTFYGLTEQCIIDRWIKEYPGSVDVTPNGLLLTPAQEADGYVGIVQQINHFSEEWNGKTATISIEVDGVISTATFTLGSLVSGITVGRVGVFSVTNGNLIIRAYKSTLDSVTISKVKLELGETSTLHLDHEANYAEQYAICSLYSPNTGKFIGDQNSNTNMLDNWYFRDPVNRMNTTTMSIGDGWAWPIDRWQAIRTNLELTPDGIVATLNSNTEGYQFFAFMQRIKYNYFHSDYTVSAIVDGELHCATLTTSDTPDANPIISNYINNVCFGIQTLSDGYLSVYLYIQGNETRTISAVKCELGSVQTLAIKNDNGEWILKDAPSNYEIEYIKCAQYDLATGVYTGLDASVVNAVSNSGGTVKGNIEIEPETGDPAVVLRDVTTTTEARVMVANGTAKLVSTDIATGTNELELVLNKDTDDVSKLVQLKHTDDGVTTTYNLYGDHNKVGGSTTGGSSIIIRKWN